MEVPKEIYFLKKYILTYFKLSYAMVIFKKIIVPYYVQKVMIIALKSILCNIYN